MTIESVGARRRALDHESARVASLLSYQILDTDRDVVFDRLTRMAAEIFCAPIAGIVFLDTDRLWFKAQLGLDLQEHSGRIASCMHAILATDLVVLEDTAKDCGRVVGSFMPGRPFYRFYAGAPLFAPSGLRLGTVCVLDYQPRSITVRQAGQLGSLAREVVRALEQRRLRLHHRRKPRSLPCCDAWVAPNRDGVHVVI